MPYSAANRLSRSEKALPSATGHAAGLVLLFEHHQHFNRGDDMGNEQRKDARLSGVVEHGIRLGDTQGCANGWAYMQAYGVPKEAIARVLAFPYARRRHASKGRP